MSRAQTSVDPTAEYHRIREKVELINQKKLGLDKIYNNINICPFNTIEVAKQKLLQAKLGVIAHN